MLSGDFIHYELNTFYLKDADMSKPIDRSLTAAYPVVAGTDNNHELVAYTVKRSGHNYIAYQQLQLK